MFLWSWTFPLDFVFVFPVKLLHYVGMGRGRCIAVGVGWSRLSQRGVCVYVLRDCRPGLEHDPLTSFGTHLKE